MWEAAGCAGNGGGRRERVGSLPAAGCNRSGRLSGKCPSVSGMWFPSCACFGIACYSVDMRIHPGSSLAQLVERDRNAALTRETIEKHVIAMAPRANFARAYIARGRTLGNGQKLDPVLASHVGLQEPAT